MTGPAAVPGVPVDLCEGSGTAVLWGMASHDLNVNLVAWPAGGGVGEHTNASRDVLVIVVGGTLEVAIDGRTHILGSKHAVLIPIGATRSIRAHAGPARYLTVHLRRPPITVGDGESDRVPTPEAHPHDQAV